MRSAGEGEIDDRLGVGLDLGDDRLVDLLGQAPAHAADPVAHVGGGGSPDRASSLKRTVIWLRSCAADRGHEVDALDAGERILEQLGDLRSR